MATGIPSDRLFSLQARQNEVWRRIKAGSLNIENVLAVTQGILDGVYPVESWTPPSWWRTPNQQLLRAHELWPNFTLPEPPLRFFPRTETEVLLLHVPRSLQELWELVEPPTGYTKDCRECLKVDDEQHLRLAPNVPNRTEPVWLGFDPEHGKGERPDQFWSQENLAASEVLSALIQFHDWPLAWLKAASAPNLAGYQLKYHTSWLRVPYLYRWLDDRQFGLNARWASDALYHWSSPIVREC